MVKVWCEYANEITDNSTLLRINVNFNLEKQWYVTFRLDNEEEITKHQLGLMLKALGNTIIMDDKE